MKQFAMLLMLLAISLMAASYVPPVWAQNAATVTGRVTNAQGQPEAAVLVRIDSLDIETTSGADGTYRLVIPGARLKTGTRVSITASRPSRRGVQQSKADGVILHENGAPLIKLSPGTNLTQDFVIGLPTVTGQNGQVSAQPQRKVGDLIDVFYPERNGKGRGTITEVSDGKYKVHYTGCKPNMDEWVDRMLVRSAATISAEATEIKFLIGKWSRTAAPRTEPGTHWYHTHNHGSTSLAWGKSNDLQIDLGGSYLWYQSGGRPPVRGKWTADPKVEGAKDGTANIDGILVKDAAGQEWKLYRRIVKSDNLDEVAIQQMCTGTGTGE